VKSLRPSETQSTFAGRLMPRRASVTSSGSYRAICSRLMRRSVCGQPISLEGARHEATVRDRGKRQQNLPSGEQEFAREQRRGA